MTELIKITHVRPLKDHWLRLWFSDGAVKDVNLDRLLARGGVFAPIRDDRRTLEAVEVNPESGTIQWPGEVDLDPDVLYGPRGALIGYVDREAHACTSASPGHLVMDQGHAFDLTRAPEHVSDTVPEGSWASPVVFDWIWLLVGRS